MGNIVNLLSGRDLTPNDYSNEDKNGIPYITGASNFYCGNLLINRWTNKPVVISVKNDLLITCKGTIGEMAYNNCEKIHIARQVMAIRSRCIYINYIEFFLKTYITTLQEKAKSFIPGIGRNDMLQILIPIPPYNEQIRICENIKKIFNTIKG